jgi:6-phosphogluconolactonase (cycloisomerase 2 family)
MKFTRIAFAAVLMLFALSNFARGDFLYVAAGEGDIHAFRVAANGTLTAVPGTPVPLGTFPSAVVVAPSGPFVYVVGGFPAEVVGFAVAPADGSLVPLAGSPFPVSGMGPIVATTDGSGRFLYVGNNVSQDISAYAIGASGQLTAVPGEPFPVVGVVGSGSIAADPLGRLLYLTSGAITAAFSVFRIDPATGAITPVPGSPFPIEPGPNMVTADPSGRFVYVTNEQTMLVSTYAIDPVSGAPGQIPGSPVDAGPRPLAITADPQGHFVFVGNFPGGVSVFSADLVTGALTPVPGSPFPSGFQPNSLQVTSAGTHLYVADPQGLGGPPISVGGIWGHVVDPSAGSLGVVPGSPFPAGRSPWALGLLATVDTPESTCGAVKANGSLSKHPRSRFALKVKLQAGEDRAEGELSYADEAGRLFFESTSIDTLVITAHHASIAGQGRANGATVGFQVEVTDGRPHTFAIQLSNGYAAAGTVAGGHTKIEECEDGEDGEDR